MDNTETNNVNSPNDNINQEDMDENAEDDAVSYTMDTGPVNEGDDDDDDDEESFKSCTNEEKADNGVGMNYPPELTDESDNASLRSAVTISSSDESTSSSSSGSGNNNGDNHSPGVYFSDDEDVDNDSDISDPGRRQQHGTHGTSATFSQRELLDYLGSLFSVSSRLRSRNGGISSNDAQQVSDMSDEQLEEFVTLRQQINNDLKILGVRKYTNILSNLDNLSRQLVSLLCARERGDWGSQRERNGLAFWSYERIKRVNNDDDVRTQPQDGEPCCKVMKPDEPLSIEEEGWDDNPRWNKEKSVSDGDKEDSESRMEDNNENKPPVIMTVDLTNVCKNEPVKIHYLHKSDDVNERILDRPKTLRQAIYGSRWSVSRLNLEQRISQHDGCVNALNWSRSGLWLASGSDDRRINITQPLLGSSKVISRFQVGHTSNIFQVRFMPTSQDLELVSCGRDGTVRCSTLSPSGQLEYSKEIASHKDACHKLDTPLDSPTLVLSAGEDGRVIASDIRVGHSCGRLCTDNKIPLYSISCNPVRSQEIAVAGKDSHVLIYDRRHANKPMLRLRPLLSSSTPNNHTGCPHLSPIGGNRYSSYYHVTSVAYSHQGDSVLASYNDDDIYLLSTRTQTTSDISCVVHKYTGHRNVQTVTGVSFYGPEHEYIISGSNDGHLVLWDRETEAIVNWLRADNGGVVNVLEPHPYEPILATAGLDHDVKIWSMNNWDNKQIGSRGLPLDDNGASNTNVIKSLLDRSPETARIDAAWKLIDERAQPDISTSTTVIDTPEPSLPFLLRDLEAVAALNWKMRAETYPYTFDNPLDNPLDNLILLSERRNGALDDDDDDDDDDDEDEEEEEESDTEISTRNRQDNQSDDATNQSQQRNSSSTNQEPCRPS